jgi:hypothetical protein
MVETVGTAVVRVWHHCGVVIQAELGEEADFVCECRRALFLHGCEVFHVHHQDQVELLKVCALNLPRSQV